MASFEIALLPQRIAEGEMGFGIVRIEFYGLPVRGDGICQPALLLPAPSPDYCNRPDNSASG